MTENEKNIAIMNCKIKCNEAIMELWTLTANDNDYELSNNLFYNNNIQLELSEIFYRFIQLDIKVSK